MDLYSITYNGYQLNLPDFTRKVMWHDFDRMPDAERSVSPVTKSHYSVATSSFWVSKTATVTIMTRGCPKNVLDAHIARIRQIAEKNGSVTLQKGVPVKSNAGDPEQENYSYNQYQTLTYANAIIESVEADTSGVNSVITIGMLLLDPIAKGSSSLTIFSGTHTTATTNIDLSSVILQGTFSNQYPVYEFTVNTITAGSTPSLSIYNGFNTLTVSQALQAGDVLVVDSDKLLVTLNNQLVDFRGVFPNIQNNVQPLQISDTFSARNITVEVTYVPRFI